MSCQKGFTPKIEVKWPSEGKAQLRAAFWGFCGKNFPAKLG